jgi:FMN hydrolase / 5-amino-6-(5-phospho-D-ribitylamino)uracil phosphatase
MSRIGAVSFDGDDTLWDFPAVLRGALTASLEELRRRVPEGRADQVTIEQLSELRERVYREHAAENLSYRELRLLAYAALLDELGHAEEGLVDELSEIFQTSRSTLIEPYPDVVPALDALAGRYTLGLITNGNADVERCVLRGRFAFRVHAEQHGVAKPDPALFAVALREAGVDASQMVHVGDSLEFDVAGARNAGVFGVWLNREGHSRDGEPAPDAEIQSLDELPPLLERLS